jgi:hypothetical protein
MSRHVATAVFAAAITFGPGDPERTRLNSPTMPQRLRLPRPEVESIIDRAIECGAAIQDREVEFGQPGNFRRWVDDLKRWLALTREALLAAYETAEPATEFYEVATGGAAIIGYGSDPVLESVQRHRELAEGLNTLRSLRERLDYAEAPGPPARTAPETEEVGRGIFLVHGHDEAMKHEVARFLERVAEPGVTILAEQPDAGRTIIEKFEQYASEAGYAVVLLTGDDEGRKHGSGTNFGRAHTRMLSSNSASSLGYSAEVAWRFSTRTVSSRPRTSRASSTSRLIRRGPGRRSSLARCWKQVSGLTPPRFSAHKNGLTASQEVPSCRYAHSAVRPQPIKRKGEPNGVSVQVGDGGWCACRAVDARHRCP